MEGEILELAVKHLNTGIIRIRRYVYLFSYKTSSSGGEKQYCYSRRH